MHIEIQDALGERVEEFRIMRNNDAGLGILLNEFREVCDSLLVEIVGRLVEQQ